MPSTLIVGASRGLGAALVHHYAKLGTVYATVRKTVPEFPAGVKAISGVDASHPDVGDTIVKGLDGAKVDLVYYVAGILIPEKFGQANWKAEIDMYTVCAVAPVFVIQALAESNSLAPKAKIIIVTSEGGSIALRTPGEGGGLYGHHASKAAANMIGRLLSFDLAKSDVPVAMIHPGFLRTEMTKGAGFADAYDSGGAITPEQAVPGIAAFADKLDLSMSGKFWAPQGAKGIGNAVEVMGADVENKPPPLELPW